MEFRETDNLEVSKQNVFWFSVLSRYYCIIIFFKASLQLLNTLVRECDPLNAVDSLLGCVVFTQFTWSNNAYLFRSKSSVFSGVYSQVEL